MKFDLLISADWHLSTKVPECRKESKEEWLGVLRDKISFILSQQKKHHCPLLIAGDLFDRWKVDHRLESQFMEWMDEVGDPDLPIITIAGQHDTPYHDPGRLSESAYNVIATAGYIQTIPTPDKPRIEQFGAFWGVNYGMEIPSTPPKGKKTWNIIMLHQFVWKGKAYPGAPKGGSLDSFRKKHKAWDLIVTGDNHQTIIAPETYSYPALINPGSLFRTRSDQDQHAPCIVGWSREEGADIIEIPVSKDVFITTSHQEAVQKDERLTTFVERLDGRSEVSLSFDDNLEAFIKANTISRELRTVIEEARDYE